MTTGVVDYFRNALAAIGRHSRLGNEKHNPGESMHWAFDKSSEHADAIASHLSQRGEIDPETGHSHSVALAWRALALLETELVAAGATPGPAVVRAPRENLHPAQKLAVEAFKREAPAPRFEVLFAGGRPSTVDGLRGKTFTTEADAWAAVHAYGVFGGRGYSVREVKS